MPAIFTVATPKGGSGKTTVAILVACELAFQGYKTLIIDADSQRSAATWYETSVKRDLRPQNIDLIATSAEEDVVNLLERNFSYDAIVIDTAGFASEQTYDLARISTLLIIPCLIHTFDARQVVIFVERLRTLAAASRQPEPKYRVVLNQYDPLERSSESIKAVYGLLNAHDIQLCDKLLFRRLKIKASTEGNGSLYQMSDKDEGVRKARANINAVMVELLSGE